MTNVAVDARWAQDAKLGGVGRTLAGLLPPLSRLVDVVALTDPRLGPLSIDVPVRPVRLPFPGPAVAWLELAVPPALRGFDVYHSSWYLLPQWCPVPALVTMHDISFETHRQWLGPVKGGFYRWSARRSVAKAAAVVTVSEWSRDQIVEHYAVDPARVVVVPNAVDREFRPLGNDDEDALERVRRRYGIERDYLLVVGGASRRRADVALAAWRLARRRGVHHQLVIVREPGPPEPGLVRTGPIPLTEDADFRMLLAGAALFLYPTEFEGFGLPGLEAAASGVPPVCSPVTALPEVLGPCAAWCDPDPEAMAERIVGLLGDDDERRRLAACGVERAARWTWDDAARQLAGLYEQAKSG